ncbi:hypothetical protein TNCT_107541 [Trichonephila clavata]|uniref:Uncharacterized protein n=1 Tax=Trichonephila clavata TaxID=2740835 RepID=A0A8X6EWQ9_TRICU|nr:hypothetical protein TNCT_107541 [Trichonephila clavata]
MENSLSRWSCQLPSNHLSSYSYVMYCKDDAESLGSTPCWGLYRMIRIVEDCAGGEETDGSYIIDIVAGLK